MTASPDIPAPPEVRLGTAPVRVRWNAAERAALLDRLVAAYPDHLAGHDGEGLHWADGDIWPLPAPSVEAMTPAQLLDSDDVLMGFAWPYAQEGVPLADPGRIRSARFFTKIYGDCLAGTVVPVLETVRWTDGSAIRVTRVAGVAEALRRVVAALEHSGAAVLDFCRDPGSEAEPAGYDCRVIAGTARRSMHAYGAAFDLNHGLTHYWQWSDAAAGGIAPYVNTVPPEIVAAFETEGFLWGGRWAHFDTMHFEYRPELLGAIAQ